VLLRKTIKNFERSAQSSNSSRKTIAAGAAFEVLYYITSLKANGGCILNMCPLLGKVSINRTSRKPPFKPVFQVAASREGSDIRIINEPLEGSSLFLVETGESRTPPETILDFLNNSSALPLGSKQLVERKYPEGVC